MCELEQEHFGADHSEVGAWLAQTWELPEFMQAAVRGSHDPDYGQMSDELRPSILCVTLSGQLADMWCGVTTEKAIQEVWETSQAFFNMKTVELVKVIKEIADGVPEVSSFFQINLGTSEDIEKVVAVAEQIFMNTAPQELDQAVATSST